MNFFISYLKQHRMIILVFTLFILIFISAFALYHLPLGAVLYPAGLCVMFGGIFLFLDIRAAYRKHKKLVEIQKFSGVLMNLFPEKITLEDTDYQQIIALLQEEYKQLENRMNQRYSDMIDYYTVWAHQIKTPIASMRLNLQNEDSHLSRKVSEDLFRIEQYVEMVLCYLRLDSDATDYVFREYDLDDIVKQVVRKFASQFIRRKIRLDYQPLNTEIITDEKWLSFVIEQVLSNALKYTQAGAVTIEMEKSDEMGKSKTLCIRDTGIGIAAEDLPRIFEKGYTGYNGRRDKKASGIGLYLCRRICGNLGHTITASSSPDSGTAIRICLDQVKVETE